jgi:uncharacterized membrane protein (DUF373 family)
MDSGKDNFFKYVLLTNKLVIKVLLVGLTLSLILASANLIVILFRRIIEPPFLVLELPLLFEGFSLVLIVAVGYELIKSLIIIITSEEIPAFPILKIAMIAVANKIITLDAKHTDAMVLFGLAALIAGLGVAGYFIKPSKNDKANES